MFALPEVEPYRLNRAPLAQALVQVRFPIVAKLGTIAGVAPLQEALRDRLPYMDPSSSALSVQVGPSGAIFEPGPPDGWQLSDDLGHRLVLAPGAASLVIGDGYRGVSEFADLLLFSLQSLATTVTISRCERIGVRYVSVVTPDPGEEKSWVRWFKPELVGWTCSPVLAATVDARADRVQVTGGTDGTFSAFPAAPHGLITSGWFPKDATLSGLPPISLKDASFILDFDFYVDGAQPFVPADLVQQFLALHDQMDRFFRWSLTDDGAERFGLELV